MSERQIGFSITDLHTFYYNATEIIEKNNEDLNLMWFMFTKYLNKPQYSEYLKELCSSLNVESIEEIKNELKELRTKLIKTREDFVTLLERINEVQKFKYKVKSIVWNIYPHFDLEVETKLLKGDLIDRIFVLEDHMIRSNIENQMRMNTLEKCWKDNKESNFQKFKDQNNIIREPMKNIMYGIYNTRIHENRKIVELDNNQ